MNLPVLSLLTTALPQFASTGVVAQATTGLFAALLGGEARTDEAASRLVEGEVGLFPQMARNVTKVERPEALLAGTGQLLEAFAKVEQADEAMLNGMEDMPVPALFVAEAKAAMARIGEVLAPGEASIGKPPSTEGIVEAVRQVAGHIEADAPEFAEKIASLVKTIAAIGETEAGVEPEIAALLARSGIAPQLKPAQSPAPVLTEFRLPAAEVVAEKPTTSPDLPSASRATALQVAIAPAANPPTGDTVEAAAGIVDPGPQNSAPPSTPSAPAQRAEGMGSTASVRFAPYAPAIAQVALPQVAFEIARQVAGGSDRFQIRLDPPELGRIEVRLDFDAGNTHARLAVERSDTLDLLQRDQRALERALAQAGLDPARTSLEFSLRQQTSGRQEGNAPHTPDPFEHEMNATAAGPEPVITLYRGAATAGGIDRFA